MKREDGKKMDELTAIVRLVLKECERDVPCQGDVDVIVGLLKNALKVARTIGRRG